MRPAGAASDRPSESIAGRAARASERSTVDAILVASEDPHVSSTVLLSSCRDRTCNVQNPASAVLPKTGRALSAHLARLCHQPARATTVRLDDLRPPSCQQPAHRPVACWSWAGKRRRPRAAAASGQPRASAAGRGGPRAGRLGSLWKADALRTTRARDARPPQRWPCSGGRAADGTAPYGYFQTSGRRASYAASPRPS